MTTNFHIRNYQPYGKVLREFSESGDKERYLTTQHERDEKTGLDYRGARYYDSDMGRFLSLDPLAKEYPSWSDYCYVAGNPISFIDPDGKEVDKPETKSEKGAGNVALTLPENAKVTARFMDSNNNGVIDWGGKEYEANPGDVRKFEVDGVSFGANFNSDGSFENYSDDEGNAYQSSESTFDTPENEGPDNTNTINPVAPAVAIISSVKFEGLKKVGALGSKRGTTVTSYALRKALPQKVGMRVLGTKVLGGIAGRAIPIVGWAWTAYEVMDWMSSETDQFIKEEYDGDRDRWLQDVRGGGCFVSGTQILMGDKSYRSIELVLIGDTIMTYDTVHKKLEKQVVLDTIKPLNPSITKLQFTDENVISSTSDHPYYVVGKGWCSLSPSETERKYHWKVNELKIGDNCFYFNGNQLVEIKLISTENINERTQTYNLSKVAINNNFFANGILVHNKMK